MIQFMIAMETFPHIEGKKNWIVGKIIFKNCCMRQRVKYINHIALSINHGKRDRSSRGAQMSALVLENLYGCMAKTHFTARLGYEMRLQSIKSKRREKNVPKDFTMPVVLKARFFIIKQFPRFLILGTAYIAVWKYDSTIDAKWKIKLD
ncbi:CLUMA_CG011337, isoform A [Clunio marinus]|uniref:CLUMA_CG011337, isoform A n=1 Tax=Clunio marinus TaxID=568069 RepID=A0A1J1ICF4_9DIPT|nr:CLUMA_CG011337, isoform A [Clunio marinus]